MRKLLFFTVILASVSFAAIGVEAKAVDTVNAVSSGSAYNAGQIFHQRRWLRRITHPKYNNHNNGRVRYETRTVWKGNKEFEDTYRITWKNGREHEKRVSRVRIR